jgi:ankyrin repeat protein
VKIALLSAIEQGRQAELKRFLAAWRDPALRFPVQPEAASYFRAATQAGNADAIDLLIRAGFDAKGDRWALENAVFEGRSTILRTLAAAGVTLGDPVAQSNLIHSALRRRDDDVLLALIEIGWADASRPFNGRVWGGPASGTLTDIALSRGLVRSSRELEKRGIKSASPLLSRLVAGDLAGMRALLPEGEWARARVFGAPLLSFAALTGNLPLVRRLVELGADPAEVATIDPNLPSRTALDEAVHRGRVEVVRFLARLPGVRTWLEPEDRPAPVGVSAGLGRWEIVRALVDAGASPNARYKDPALRDGYSDATPLHRAAFEGNLEMVDYLLAHGADPRAEAEPKVLPVEVAKGDEVVRALVEAGGGGP